MLLFQNQDDQKQLEKVFKAYLSEWGAENIVVSIPVEWKRFSGERLGKVRIEFHAKESVAIRAELDNMPMSKYEMAVNMVYTPTA